MSMAEVLDFTTLTTLWQQYAAMPRQLAFRATTCEEWAVWREQLSAKLIDLLGGFPTREIALQPIVLEQRELPDYALERVAFQSEEGLYTPCYVLTPRNVEPPYRPVIALHGHGSGGAAHLLGVPRSEETSTAGAAGFAAAGAGAAAGAAASWAATASKTSCLRMRPPTPVPFTEAMSMLCWLAKRRTSGVT